MPCQQQEVARLATLIQRLHDADLLTDPLAETLVAESAAAAYFSQQGEEPFVRRHVERIALFTRALVRTAGLSPADGEAVIQAADGILSALSTTHSERMNP